MAQHHCRRGPHSRRFAPWWHQQRGFIIAWTASLGLRLCELGIQNREAGDPHLPFAGTRSGAQGKGVQLRASGA